MLPLVAAACGIATFSVMDALMKSASLASGVYAALLWRSVLGSCVGLVLWRPFERAQWPGRGRLLVHVARSGVSAGMAFLFFWGLVRTPMAVGMALSFIAPILALYLAAFALGEAVTRRALVASVAGLAGVVVIGIGRLGEGSGSLAGAVAILGSAVLYAVNLVLQRHQAQMASPAEITFFQGLFIALFLLPGALWQPALPVAGGWPMLVGAAGLGSVSLVLLAWGWARAPAHRLLPIEYSGFVWAAVMGWWWFGEAVSGWTLAGVALILSGCWYGAGGRGDESAV